MISIKDTQRKFHVNKDAIKKTAQSILDDLKYADFDLGIW